MRHFCSVAALLIAVLAGSLPAHADDHIYAVPAGWKLQNFVGGNLVAYYAGTPCFSGQILMPETASQEDRDRFLSMLMTAKAANRNFGVYYETASGHCRITSFYLQD